MNLLNCKCPVCRTPLRIDITIESESENPLDIDIQAKSMKIDMVMSELVNYWRWYVEEKTEDQEEYIRMNNYIKYVGNNEYEYEIQTMSSDTGDRYITGKIKFLITGDVEIN